MTAETFLLFLAGNACFLAAGLGVARATGWWMGRRELPAAIPIAYVLGVAAYGVVAQAAFTAGLAMSLPQVLLVCAGLAALGLLRPARVVALGRGRVATPLAALALAMAALLVVDLWYQPLWAFDAWTFWTPKARALVELDGLRASWFTSADLTSRDYPLLLPAVEAAVFRFTGVQPWTLDLQSFLLVAALVGTLVSVASGRAAALTSWSFAAAILVAPSVGIQTAYAEADIPLAAFFAVAGVGGWLYLTEGSRSGLWALGICVAACVATKVEGLLFAVALVAALAAVVVARRARLAVLVVGAGAVAAAAVPWKLWASAHDIPSQTPVGRLADVSLLVERADTLPTILVRIGREVLDPTSWLLLSAAAVAALVLALSRRCARREATYVGAALVLSLAGLVVAYWTTSFDLGYHLDTSARRVVTGPVLLAAVLAPLLLERAGVQRIGRYSTDTTAPS